MRLDILDRGHRMRTKAVLAVIRLVSRQPVVDAVKLAFYRPEFYGGGDLTHEAMRGPSDWSVGDRELMAAFVSQANDAPFCVAAHSATSSTVVRRRAKVAATLGDLDTAPIEEPLRATLRMLGKLTRSTALMQTTSEPCWLRAFPSSRSKTPWPYVWRSTSPTGWPTRSTSASRAPPR